jgi:hypothetical protein
LAAAPGLNNAKQSLRFKLVAPLAGGTLRHAGGCGTWGLIHCLRYITNPAAVVPVLDFAATLRDILTLLLEARDPETGEPLSEVEIRAIF